MVRRGGSAPRPRRGAGELEREVLAALWACGGPAPLGEVTAALDGEPAANTVQTIMTRLYRKGLVARRRSGHGYAYWPVVAPEQLAAEKMREALETGTDRQSVLLHFVTGLNATDAAALRAFLDGEDAEDGDDPGAVRATR